MSPDSKRLLELAEALADGAATDWEREAANCSDKDERKLVHALGFLSSVFDVHQSLRGQADQPSPDSPAAMPTPETWGPLRILDVAGSGSFGTVYRAHDPRIDRVVALKLRLASQERDPDAVVEEARMMAQVRHPHVVSVFGAERRDDQVGVWMEYVEGQTLEQLLAQHGALGASETVAVGLELCSALSAVHAAGLIHGDVKTQNVMRETGGRLVLMDFGAGGCIDAESSATQQRISGTPLFMAPEVLRGQAKTVRSDIYSLGVLLYNLLTQRFPVGGSTIAEIAEAHAQGDVSPLRDQRPELSRELIEIISRALSHDPGRRFASAGEFEAALLATRGASAKSPRDWRPGVAVAALLLLAVTVATVGWFGLERFGLRQNRSTLAPSQKLPLLSAQLTSQWWRSGTQVDERLADGDRLQLGDQVYLVLTTEEPIHLYVVNFDLAGNGYLLFPVREAQSANPLASGRHRLPGDLGWAYDSWEITSVGGEESFLIVAARRPLDRIETLLAALPPSTPQGPVELSGATLESLDVLRGAGRLSRSRQPGAADALQSQLEGVLNDLAQDTLSEDELVIREVVLRNP